MPTQTDDRVIGEVDVKPRPAILAWDWHVAQVFAIGQRRMRAAIWLAGASDALVEFLSSRRTQCSRISLASAKRFKTSTES